MTVRPVRPEDLAAIVEACQDPEIPRWTNVPSPYTDENGRRFIDEALGDGGPELSLAVADHTTDALLGVIGLRLPDKGVGELGYWIAAGERGRGVATRAARLLSRWAFEQLGLARIHLLAHPDNRASQRVAERAGFRREGLLRSWAEMHGERVDLLMFSLLPGEL